MDRKEYEKIYYQKNKEKIKNRTKKYKEKNKDKYRLYSKHYHETHREEERKRSKEYCHKNKERINKYAKEYREKNKDKLIQYRKKYYQKNKLREKIYNQKRNKTVKGKISNKIRKYKHRKKGFTPIMINSFPEKILIDYHHIFKTSSLVIPIPKYIHRKILGQNHFSHNEEYIKNLFDLDINIFINNEKGV